jgi:hypothetical protein
MRKSQQRDHREIEKRNGLDAHEASKVEALEMQAAGDRLLVQQATGNEQAAQREEDVNAKAPHVMKMRRAQEPDSNGRRVTEEHDADGDRSPSVQGRYVPRLPWAERINTGCRESLSIVYRRGRASHVLDNRGALRPYYHVNLSRQTLPAEEWWAG